MKEIKTINDINRNNPEGDILIAAIGQLSTKEGYTDKTPEQILKELNNITKRFCKNEV